MNTNQINEEYTSTVYETAKKRITLAGYRIANIVINIYETAGGFENYDKESVENKWKRMK